MSSSHHKFIRAYALLLLGSVLFLSFTTSATTPAFKPMTIEEKLKIADSIFIGTVHKLYFTDGKNALVEPSQVKGLSGSTAIVKISEAILDRRKLLTPFVHVPLGGRAQSAKERLDQYDGKTFVFFGRYLYPEEKDGKKMAFVMLLGANGVDDPSNLDAIRKAVRQSSTVVKVE